MRWFLLQPGYLVLEFDDPAWELHITDGAAVWLDVDGNVLAWIEPGVA